LISGRWIPGEYTSISVKYPIIFAANNGFATTGMFARIIDF
jgi:hypothetical protein